MTLSPLVTVALTVQLVVVLPVCGIPVPAVTSAAPQLQPCGAAVANVMTGAHAVCPAVNDPADAPPVIEPTVPQPDGTVKAVPFDSKAPAFQNGALVVQDVVESCPMYSDGPQ